MITESELKQLLEEGCEIHAKLEGKTPDSFGVNASLRGHTFLCTMAIAGMIGVMAEDIKEQNDDRRLLAEIRADILSNIGKMCGIELDTVGQCEPIRGLVKDESLISYE